MKRLSLILACLAGTASADVDGLADCYFERGMAAVGVVPSAFSAAETSPVRQALREAAVSAYDLIDLGAEFSALNAAALMTGGDPEIIHAMISCHYTFFAE